MDRIHLKARAKINLGLDVVGKRPDGYHEVRMVMQMLQLHDQVWIERVKEPGIRVETNLSFLPTDDRNIAYRAADLLMTEYGIREGVKIRIDKHIPVAAGMAGGSTNCAAVLIGMNRLFGLRLSEEELMALGVRLGADVPYCILGRTALSEGIGEILTPVPGLPECSVLVAKPPFSVSTKYVYSNLKLDTISRHPDIDGMLEALAAQDLYGVTDRLANVLETVTIPEHPEIEKIKQLMLEGGARGALMSGSGPTVFGIFDREEAAGAVMQVIRGSGLARQIYLTTPFNPHRDRREKPGAGN